jgi:hypothetical protein
MMHVTPARQPLSSECPLDIVNIARKAVASVWHTRMTSSRSQLSFVSKSFMLVCLSVGHTEGRGAPLATLEFQFHYSYVLSQPFYSYLLSVTRLEFTPWIRERTTSCAGPLEGADIWCVPHP